MGWATSWIDTTIWIKSAGSTRMWITASSRLTEILTAIHTAREGFPYGGTVLAVRLIRLLSVLMGAGTIYFTYQLAKEFSTTNRRALFAAAFAAFTPMFVFISGAVNNDNLATFLSAIILFLLVRASGLHPRPFTTRTSLLLGIAIASPLSPNNQR